jgi:hypothetical protein
MIEILPGFPDNVVALACRGHVTKEDYDGVLVPTVEKALKEHEKVRLYYEVDPDFTGIEPGAVWEDFRVGVEHLSRWERIALVTDVSWIAHTMMAFSFLMPAEMKLFGTADEAAARDWIAGP